MVQPSTSVFRRSVFLIGGYEPKSSEAFFARTRRELRRFEATWDVSAEITQQSLSEDSKVARARISTTAADYRVHTELHFFVWNDLVLRDFARPTVWRVAKYLVTFLDYLCSGTFFRIAAQAWRFSLYFLYPAFVLCLLSGLAWFASAGLASLSSGLLDRSPWASVAVGVAVRGCSFAAILWGLLRLSSRRWFVLHLMDLWSFSRDHLRGRRPDADANRQRFAQAVVSRARAAEDDEIILVGHSTGGALILEIAAAALAQEPNLGRVGPRIVILTVGSTALKIGLHPAAKSFRRSVASLVEAPGIQWVECQAHTDLVNFYKTDPVAAMGLKSNRAGAFPQVHIVRIRDMLQPEAYRRFKYNIFRVHYQFIMANTQRYAYDFFRMCCGSQPFIEQLGHKLRWLPGPAPESLAATGRPRRQAASSVSLRMKMKDVA